MTPDYILRRVGLFFLSVFIGVTLVFLLTRLAPGDPIEAQILSLEAQSGNTMGDIGEIIKIYRKRFRLDEPLHIQYFIYLSNLLRGDLGYSLSYYPDRVSDRIRRALPWSLGLIGVTTSISAVLGMLFGALIIWRNSWLLLRALLPVLMVSAAVPFFLFGLIVQFVFATEPWKILPPSHGHDFGFVPGWNLETVLQLIKHAILPSVAIIIGGVALWGLGTRALMVNTTGEDYMLLGEAKGLRERRLFLGYAIRNILLPQTTAFSLALAAVVSGQVIVEIVFNYPGLGHQLRVAAGQSDYFVIQGIALIIIVAIAMALLIMDLIYPLIDPRISYKRS